ncbi:hypothetical protein M9458_050481, partial [Cirrhinus mrigala]
MISHGLQQTKAKEDAYRKGDRVLYNQARNTLNKEIRVAKRTYAKRLEYQFTSNEPASVWKGLKTITNYKTPSPSTEANQRLAEDLNEFYCRFDTPHTRFDNLFSQPLTLPTTPLSPPPALQISEDEVRQVFRKNKRRKAPGPDGVTPACLKTCADQLAPIFSQIFNRSLELCEVPSCLKRSTIIPVPKKTKITGLSNYRPVALTSVAMKSFKKTGSGLSEEHHCNIWTDQGLISICQWITSFLTDRQQLVRLGKSMSSSRTTNTGAPQGCVLSPLLFSLYTNDCTSKDPSVKLLKFADDTTLIGLIQDGEESAYRQEVKELAVCIMDSTVATVETFKFLGSVISQDLKWVTHINSIVKKAQQRLYFLHQLRKFNLPQELLKQFYSAIIESVLCTSITVWFGSATKSDIRRLQAIVRTAERIIGASLPTLQELYSSR